MKDVCAKTKKMSHKMGSMNKIKMNKMNKTKMNHMNKSKMNHMNKNKMNHMNKNKMSNMNKNKMNHMNKSKMNHRNKTKMNHMNKMNQMNHMNKTKMNHMNKMNKMNRPAKKKDPEDSEDSELVPQPEPTEAEPAHDDPHTVAHHRRAEAGRLESRREHKNGKQKISLSDELTQSQKKALSGPLPPIRTVPARHLIASGYAAVRAFRSDALLK